MYSITVKRPVRFVDEQDVEGVELRKYGVFENAGYDIIGNNPISNPFLLVF